MSGTVVEVVDMKVEEEVEEIEDPIEEPIELEEPVSKRSLRQDPRTLNKDYGYMDQIMERQGIDDQLIEEVKKNPCIYDPAHMYARDSFLKETTWRQIASTLNVAPEYCKLRWKSLRDRYVKTQKEERRRRESGIHKLSKPYRYAKQLAFLRNFSRGINNYDEMSAMIAYGNGDVPSEHPDSGHEIEEDEGSSGTIEQGWAAAEGYMSSPSSSHHTSNDHHITNNVKEQSSHKRKTLAIPANDYVMNYLGMEGENGPPAKRSAQSQPSPSTSDDRGTLNHAPLVGEDPEQSYDEVFHFLVSLAPAMRRLSAQKQSLARIKIQTVLHELEFS
ncbi:uncharacterized protein LOC129257771 [Lytechinus pictus]|uniref:uncharacterized protein LOC129257771 n=1 Tax=Lytechinus pictus TaxID=7653 RepID=UPI00240D1FF7|nr:uncharacterized protein LOC129257771 [Lytechinus pictus]